MVCTKDGGIGGGGKEADGKDSQSEIEIDKRT